MGVTTIGFKEFEAKCLGMTEDLLEECDLEIKDAADTWEGLAYNAAPVDQGQLRGLIKADDTVTNHSADITSGAEYSAFLEWGTKTKVRIPAGLQSYAAEFRGNGSGKGQAKFMIYAWMNRVGIPKEFQWIVFISIIVKGINPHPYFFIQEPIVSKEFYEHIQNILKTEH